MREWGGVWTGFMWLRIESSGGLVNTVTNFNSITVE
jgi:hypothetical protein